MVWNENIGIFANLCRCRSTLSSFHAQNTTVNYSRFVIGPNRSFDDRSHRVYPDDFQKIWLKNFNKRKMSPKSKMVEGVDLTWLVITERILVSKLSRNIALTSLLLEMSSILILNGTLLMELPVNYTGISKVKAVHFKWGY